MGYNKYNNKKTVIDGFKFDSEMESHYYIYLKHLKEIGKSVFSECTNIESILIPESVTRISSGAFSNCKNLTLLDLSNVKIHKISKFMCCKCKNLKTVILPNTIKKISKYPNAMRLFLITHFT